MPSRASQKQTDFVFRLLARVNTLSVGREASAGRRIVVLENRKKPNGYLSRTNHFFVCWNMEKLHRG